VYLKAVVKCYALLLGFHWFNGTTTHGGGKAPMVSCVL